MIRADKPFNFEHYDFDTVVETSDPKLALVVAEYLAEKLKISLAEDKVYCINASKKRIKRIKEEIKKQVKLSND